MNGLVLYDSSYGNTEKLAQVVAESLDADIRLLKNMRLSDLDKLDLLIVGSPTQGGRPTKAMQEFLKQLPENSLEGIAVAAFDTRFAIKDHGVPLHILMKTIGFAAPRIANILIAKGGKLVVAAKGFIVTGKAGPLQKNEEKQAAKWAKKVALAFIHA